MIMNIKLTDVCDILYGYPFDSSKFNSNNGIGVVRIRDIVRGYTETFTTEDCSEQYAVKKGDILVGMDGEFNIAKWQGAPAMLNQRVCKLSPKANLDKNYLFYHMPIILKSIEARTPFVTVKHLSAKELNNVYLQLPSIEEQRKIALVLSTIDLLIGNYYTQLQDLGNLVKSRFNELFGDLLKNKFNWPIVNFQDVVYFQEGPGIRNWQFKDKGIKLINIRNLVDDELNLKNTSNYLSEEEVKQRYNHFLLDIGDYVMASSGVTWGKIAEIHKEHLPLCLNTSIIRLRPYDEKIILRKFLFHYIKSDVFRNQIEKLITGSAQPNFGPSHLRKILILLPNIETQKIFSDFVTQVDKSKLAVQQSLNELETLKKSLMQQYFG